ncbi:MAG: glycerol-3-phosphate acyltransferase [Chloroflexota bacterium]|nr:glycerol-3-phosphate acyltransferase [Chloroflexota bacterium]
MFRRILLIIFGYLCGSVSFAYVTGRLGRAIDLRHYGSRKLSGSNAYETMGFPAMVATGIGDIAKAVLPTWLAMHLGCGLPTIIMTGLAAMLGHNWSLFFRFKGGRGISTALGALFVVFPWGALWILGWTVLGGLRRHMAAIPALFGFVTLPLFAVAMGQAPALVWGCLGMLLVVILKRVEGNREPLPDMGNRWTVLWRRLWLDRDMADHDRWIHRTPES